MLASSRDRILASLGPDDVVLDIGGWAEPFPRADWVIDLLPYETRGLYGEPPDPETERFRADTWVVRDICDREQWPFADKQFDFVICSHTLEDLRDPVWASSEIVRVGRRGYIEVPSRVEEQTLGIKGPWVGWSHHHWLVDRTDGGLQFVFKHQIIQSKADQHLPPGFCDELSPEERVETLWWTDQFACAERIFTDPEELDEYLSGYVAGWLERRPPRRRRRRRR